MVGAFWDGFWGGEGLWGLQAKTWERMGAGVPSGLQNQYDLRSGSGGFDSHTLPPVREKSLPIGVI